MARSTIAIACCIVATVVATAALGSPPTSKTFRDAAGEDPAGPDITTVTVSSDGYELTFGVDIPTNRVVTPDFRLRIWLDVDDDRSTGISIEGEEPSGLDHFLLVDPTRFRADEAVA